MESKATAGALVTAGNVLRDRDPAPGARVVALRRLLALAQDSRRQLDGLDLGPDRALVGPLRSARADAARQVGAQRQLLDRTVLALKSAVALFGGKHRILLLATNNAEMRAGMGTALQGGVLTADDGRLTLDDMRSLGDLKPPPGAVPVPPDLARRWGAFDPTQDFRELFVSPRFDLTAPVAGQMWQAVGGGPVEAVVAIDPIFLQAIMAATGPVDAAGHTYDAAHLPGVLLHDQYQGGDAFEPSAEAARRQVLNGVARAVFDRIGGATSSPGALADALRISAQARHVMVWSEDPTIERGWLAAGVGGALGPSSVLVSVLNRGVNKLDFFLHTAADVRIVPNPIGSEISIAVHIENHVPPGEPPYIAGPNYPGAIAGDYHGIVQLHLPGAAKAVTIVGVPTPEISGPDGPSWVVATPILLHAGQTTDILITFELDGRDPLRLEPSARFPPTTWSVAGRRRPGEGFGTISR
ncbi:MAG: hypothetical protein NVS3B21_03050 [Acidimicrobiales bacterium]